VRESLDFVRNWRMINGDVDEYGWNCRGRPNPRATIALAGGLVRLSLSSSSLSLSELKQKLAGFGICSCSVTISHFCTAGVGLPEGAKRGSLWRLEMPGGMVPKVEL